MSSADLRGSVRSALALKPHRAGASIPYLDKISVSKHRPTRGRRNRWNHLLIQPISVPDLSHTGISSAFEPPKPPLMRPDGSVDSGLRAIIREKYANATATDENRKKSEAKFDDSQVEEAKVGAGKPNFENFLDFVYGPSNISGEYRRNYEQQMRAYSPIKDETKPKLLRISPNPERELFTTNINYDSYSDTDL